VTSALQTSGGESPCASSLDSSPHPSSSTFTTSTGSTTSSWHPWCNYIPSWSETRKCSRPRGDTLRSSYRTSYQQVHDLHKHNYNRSSLEMPQHTPSTALHCSSRARAGGTPPTAPSPLPFDDSPHLHHAPQASSLTSPRSPSRASARS
jgi:hypothetical protein